jgi:predicted Zn-dependent protease
MPVTISTARRLQYGCGYLALGLVNEAFAEIEAIEGPDRLSLDVLRFRVNLFMEAKQWKDVVALAQTVCAAAPGDPDVWVSWAYALRELQRVVEAREVLLQAEPLHAAANPVIHYNLACYYALLGDLPEARRRLALACKADKDWAKAALDDPDLEALRSTEAG